MILQINEDKNQLAAIEDKILKLLFESKGNILDDEVLINTLEEAKKTSALVGGRLEEAEKTEGRITEAREKYRPVASRGSLLFFLLNSLNKVHAFYAFSLNAFVVVFARGIDNTPGGRKPKIKMSFRRLV